MTTERQLIAVQIALLMTLGLVALLTVDVRRLQRATAPRLVAVTPTPSEPDAPVDAPPLAVIAPETWGLAHEKTPPDEPAGPLLILADRAD